jgi:hypothetical protein
VADILLGQIQVALVDFDAVDFGDHRIGGRRLGQSRYA